MRVVNLRRFEKNSLKAFLDIELPSGMIIRGATLQLSHGKYWIGLPAKPWEAADGAESWAPITDFRDQATKNRFQELATAAALEVLEAAP